MVATAWCASSTTTIVGRDRNFLRRSWAAAPPAMRDCRVTHATSSSGSASAVTGPAALCRTRRRRTKSSGTVAASDSNWWAACSRSSCWSATHNTRMVGSFAICCRACEARITWADGPGIGSTAFTGLRFLTHLGDSGYRPTLRVRMPTTCGDCSCSSKARAWSGRRSGRRRLWDFWVTCAGCRAGGRPSGWGGAGAVRALQHAAISVGADRAAHWRRRTQSRPADRD